MSRKKSREYAFKLVFEKFFHEPELDIDLEEEGFVLDDTDKSFANSLIGGVNEHYDDILAIIKRNIVGYELERVFKIDLAILVLAVYEMKFAKELDSTIIINEAVELSKKYSTDKSYSFINGVLAKVVKDVE